jgi:hypothetical protein
VAWGGMDLSPEAPPKGTANPSRGSGAYRDRRLRYLHTERRTNDGGHSPRALGLALAADLEVGPDGATTVGPGAGPHGERPGDTWETLGSSEARARPCDKLFNIC